MLLERSTAEFGALMGSIICHRLSGVWAFKALGGVGLILASTTPRVVGPIRPDEIARGDEGHVIPATILAWPQSPSTSRRRGACHDN